MSAVFSGHDSITLQAEGQARSSARWLIPQLLLWLLAVGAAAYSITAYDFSTEQPLPGVEASQWPESTRLTRTPGRSTLLLFLHPKCPCSRATLVELERLAEQLQSSDAQRLEFIVVATVPSSHGEAWLTTGTVAQARRILNAKVLPDIDGAEAQNFGAVTSGMVMLYDPDGACQYAGGITVARGQQGENVGWLALAEALKGGRVAASGIPAFGCRLCLPESIASSAIRPAS
jgi:hypothetical protein